MRAVPRITGSVAGLAQVRVEFVSEGGEWGVRPPVAVDVADEGGSIPVELEGGRKALKKLPESETEARAAIQTWIDEWRSMPDRGTAA